MDLANVARTEPKSRELTIMKCIHYIDNKTSPEKLMSRWQVFRTVAFGILLPILALAVNYNMCGGSDYDMLYMVGAAFFIPRQSYLYITIGSGIITLLLWLVFFRASGKRYNGFLAGILLFNALFYFAFGIAGIYRLFLIPVWLPPFCAVPILFLSSLRALRIARSVMRKQQVVLTSIAGFLFVIIVSLLIVQQPWDLIKQLPNAKGANLSGVDMSYVYLSGCYGVTFEEANLSNADLSYARLVHCNLNMHKANLQRANLSHSSFSYVNLTEADLRGANLNNAEITGVDFTGADLRGVSLGFHARGRITMDKANVCGTDVSKIKNIRGVYTWEGTLYDSETSWPEDFNPKDEGAILLTDKKL